MLNLSAFRPAHFLPYALIILAGWGMGLGVSEESFLSALLDVLPTLLAVLGGALCVFYGRMRQAVLVLVVYLAYYALSGDVQHFRLHRAILDERQAQLYFHLTSLLLPLLYGLYGLWSERAELLQDLTARAAVLVAVLGVTVGMAMTYPTELLQWVSLVRWPVLHAPWMKLVQLAYPAFALAFVALLIQYLRQPRPLHAAQLVGVLGLFWMLPQIYELPYALAAMVSMVLLALVAAVAHEAYQMAFLDELTGLPGRRALNERLQRLGRNYVIAMSDVDHFKKFNDTYGHDVGDDVLRMVASQLRKVTGGGTAYRYGGEEFTVLFPGKSLEHCLPHLEALRRNIEQYQMALRDKNRPEDAAQGRQQRGRAGTSPFVSVTISIGVAERSGEHREPEEVIKAADEALYKAKGAGRNCVVSHGGKGSRAASRRKAAAG
ncbi:MAG TPA: GGDEF domain-containing protein [Pseudomonas sp.]|nr:GGDEF domain-containing protein [Pseudomonas sp.]